MRWFKHYSEARRSPTLSALIAERDLEAVGVWWILLELLGERDPDRTGECRMPLAELAREMNMKPSRTERYLARIASVSRSRFQYAVSEERMRTVTFRFSNFAELNERRGGKREAKTEQNKSKNPVEVRSKKEEVRGGEENSTPTPIKFRHPTEVMESGFNADPEAMAKIIATLEKALGTTAGEFSPTLRNAIPVVATEFRTHEAFRAWLKDMVQAMPKDIKEKSPEYRRYVRKAVLSEAGMIA